MLTRRTALQAAFGIFATQIIDRTAMAESPPASVTHTEIFRHDLPNVAGKQGIIVSTEYAPGAGATKHRHPGPVFAYVVQGSIISQLGTAPPITYAEGDTWYEPPGLVHGISRNASPTIPAKVITFFVADRHEVLTVPI